MSSVGFPQRCALKPFQHPFLSLFTENEAWRQQQRGLLKASVARFRPAYGQWLCVCFILLCRYPTQVGEKHSGSSREARGKQKKKEKKEKEEKKALFPCSFPNCARFGESIQEISDHEVDDHMLSHSTKELVFAILTSTEVIKVRHFCVFVFLSLLCAL